MPDQHQPDAVFLGVADQLEGAAAHLADRARRAFDRVRMHRLDRIDHQQLGRVHRTQRGQDIAHPGGGGELDRRVGQPEARGAHADLPGSFLAADIDDAMPAARDLGRGLKQQCRFADARIAAQQDCRPRDQSAAQRAIEFGEAGGLARRQGAGLVELDELDRAPPARQIVFHREHRRRSILRQRVPFGAIGALPLPAIGYAATGLTDIAFLGFRHARLLTGTFRERNCLCRFIPS